MYGCYQKAIHKKIWLAPPSCTRSPIIRQLQSRRRGLSNTRVRTSLARAGACLLWLAAASATSVHLALGLRIGTDILEGSSVLVVAVDASQFTTVDRRHTLNVDVALALFGALPIV
jgi:hypothetical protein